MRDRRSYELMADYSLKLLNRHQLTSNEIESLTLVPHSNGYLKISGQLAERVNENLADRPTVLIKMDRPLVIMGDEPVLLLSDGPALEADVDEFPRVACPNIDPKNVITLQFGRGVGVWNADAVAMP